MNIPADIAQIEADLKILEIPLAEFLREVGVQRVTWWRWKNRRQEPYALIWHTVTEAGKLLRKRALRRPRAA